MSRLGGSQVGRVALGIVTSLQALCIRGWHLKAWLKFLLRLWSLTWYFEGNAQTSNRYVLWTVIAWQVTVVQSGLWPQGT